VIAGRSLKRVANATIVADDVLALRAHRPNGLLTPLLLDGPVRDHHETAVLCAQPRLPEIETHDLAGDARTLHHAALVEFRVAEQVHARDGVRGQLLQRERHAESEEPTRRPETRATSRDRDDATESTLAAPRREPEVS
jgi:hypothetical protein